MKYTAYLIFFAFSSLSLADETEDKRISALEERVAKLERLVETLSSSQGKKTTAPAEKAKNKYGIPDEVFDLIQSKAEKAWPDDFGMQKFSIEQEVKAYKSLKE